MGELSVLQLRSGPVQTTYLLVMTMVQDVSYSISHGLETSVSSSITCTLDESFLGSLYQDELLLG